MARLYVFNKATFAVVAIIEGPDGVSCEHAAGHADASGKQPYCSPDLGWEHDAHDGCEGPCTMVPRNTGTDAKGQPVYARDKKNNIEHDHVALVGVEDAPVIQAATLDVDAEVGTPGAPHKMTQAQLDEHIRNQAAEQRKLAEKHGLKVK
jgi:hypothetical protein